MRYAMAGWMLAAVVGLSASGAGTARAGHADPQGNIHGKLIGADGKPIGSAWVTAIPAEGEIPDDKPEQLTEEDGSFSLDVTPGRYLVVANFDWPATEAAPVLTTYYPSAEKEAEAKAVVVAANQKVTGIDIHVTRVLTPKYFNVVVLGADGSPAANADAYLTQTNQAGIAGADGGVSFAKDGKVRLLGFAGIDYLLFAEVGHGAAKVCSPVMKLPHDLDPPPAITVTLSLKQPACGQQEDAARKAAYATQTR